MLGESSEANPRPFATLILERRHDDPVLLAASIAGAVQEHAHVDEGVYSALRGSRRAGTVAVAVPALARVDAERDPLVVFALSIVHALSNTESLTSPPWRSGFQKAHSWHSRAQTAEHATDQRLRANDPDQLTARDLAMTATEADPSTGLRPGAS